MTEVEIKLPVADGDSIKEGLEKLGFVPAAEIREEDRYFDNSLRQIRENGEALRIRKVKDLLTGREETVITFKGRKLDSVSMTRRELETGIGDADTGIRILEALGFGMIPPKVTKIRQEYTLGQMTACIDQVQELGCFLELEMVIPEEESREDALKQIEETLEKLGYSMRDTVRTSYLGMLQQISEE